MTAGPWVLWVLAIAACGAGDKLDCEAGQVACDGACIDAIPSTAGAVSGSIFQVSCGFGACHGGVAPQEGLALDSQAGLADAVGTPSRQRPAWTLIDPADPARSYLLAKMRGVDLPSHDSTGERPSTVMPPGRGLCDAKVDAVAAWIQNGAPD